MSVAWLRHKQKETHQFLPENKCLATRKAGSPARPRSEAPRNPEGRTAWPPAVQACPPAVQACPDVLLARRLCDWRGDPRLGRDSSGPHRLCGWQVWAQQPALRQPPGRWPGATVQEVGQTPGCGGAGSQAQGSASPEGTRATSKDASRAPSGRQRGREAAPSQEGGGARSRARPRHRGAPQRPAPPHAAGPDAGLTPRPLAAPGPSLFLSPASESSASHGAGSL